jgi:PadR family transcriptional regulator, regulatory protein AphA
MTLPKSHPPDVRPEFVALGFLEERSLHGYDLYRRFEAALGKVWHISQSQMYSILKRLEAQGLVEAELEPGKRNQAKRILSGTELGKARFSEWLLSPSDCGSRIIRLEFISRLYFARQSHPGLLARIVEGQRLAIARQLGNHESLLSATQASETFNRLGLELRIHQLRGIKLWIEESVAALLVDK